MANPVVEINSIDVTDEVAYNQLSFSLGKLDLTLVDPAAIPALDDTVTVDAPAWSGTVASLTITDNDLDGHMWVKVTATNMDEAIANPASNDLVDTDGDFRKLSVTTSKDSAGTETIHGTLETFVSGFIPGHVFELTSATHGYAAQEFSITDVSVSWLNDETPLYTITFGDAIVTLSAWVNEDSGVLPITTTKITDGAVSSPKIAANSINAQHLTAVLVLASMIKTGVAGARLELDNDGFRAYDAADELVMNIPTNGDPVYVSGEFVANSLSMPGSATLMGNMFAEADSTITLMAGVVAPNDAPQVTRSMESDLTLEALPEGAIRTGGYYDPNGGADGATPCFVTVVKAGTSVAGVGANALWVYEYDITTGALDRSTELAYDSAYVGKAGFITRIGTHWYVCLADSGWPSGTQTTVLKFLRSNGSFVANEYFDVWQFDSEYGWPIKTDGTDLYIAGPASANNFKVIKVNTSLSHTATVNLTEPAFPSGVTGWTPYNWNFEVANATGTTRFWYSMVSGSATSSQRIYEFNMSTGALVSNSDFALHYLSDRYAFFWDGSNFWNGDVDTLSKYTNLDGTNPMWFAYSWYDSVGTTHESDIGPKRQVTPAEYRRRKISVKTPTDLPGIGGADDPDGTKVYGLISASEPADTSMRLQATLAGGGSVTLNSLDTGSATANGGTPFPAGTPAYMTNAESTYGDWSFQGNGKWYLRGYESGANIEIDPAVGWMNIGTGGSLYFGNQFHEIYGDQFGLHIILEDRLADEFTLDEKPVLSLLGSYDSGATGNQGSITSQTAITGATLPVQVWNGRRYYIYAECFLSSTVASDRLGMELKVDSTQIQSTRFVAGTTTATKATCSRIWDCTSNGIVDIAMFANRVTGTGTVTVTQGTSNPTVLYIMNMGLTP